MRPESSTVQQHIASAPTPPTVQIVGVQIAHTDYRSVLEWMDAMVRERQRGYVCVCNVHTVTASRDDAELNAALAGSSINVPDGQPLRWAMNLLGHPLADRVYGPELMLRACSHAVNTGQRNYFYGGSDAAALAQLTLNLRRDYPGIAIVGGHSPPHRPLTDRERTAVAEEINGSQADIVWVGIGVPKQEKWMAQMRPLLQAPVLIGVGAAFDFHAGLVPQASPRLQAAGLEWAYRLAREPRRLWRRYLTYNPRFVVAFGRQLLRQRRRTAR
jgi:N-acetylglucosaminyldiphosphoundecaprenol N-acetyl-beta-D-mannosaminyltransferase